MSNIFFKKSVFLIIIFIIAFFAILNPTSAAENFYVQLNIIEQQSANSVKFSLARAIAIYGDYESFYSAYKEDDFVQKDYVIESFNANKESQGKYFLNSSRFTYWDGETGGGVVESDSGNISTVIPYDRNAPTAFIIIDNKGVKTDYIALPVAQLEEEFEKIPLCKKENEKVDLNNNKCCSGFIPAPQEDNSYVCVNCGDGKCSKYETYNTCYKDCPMQAPSQEQTGKNIGLFLSIIGALAAVGLIAAAIIIIARSRRN